MDRLKPRLDERERINELANEHAAVLEKLERHDNAVREVKVLLGVATKKLEEVPAPVDSSRWQSIVDQIIALGSIEENCASDSA